jgi:predicted DNA-binding protein
MRPSKKSRTKPKPKEPIAQYLLDLTPEMAKTFKKAAAAVGGDSTLGRIITEIGFAGRSRPPLIHLAALRILARRRDVTMPEVEGGFVRVHWRCPEDLHNQLMVLSNAQGRTAAEIYREALQAWVMANGDLARTIASLTKQQYQRELEALGLDNGAARV